MGKVFNKGLKEEEKKEGLLKRLKNIVDKFEEQLKAIRNKGENIKEVTDFVTEPLSLEARVLIKEIKSQQKVADYIKLNIRSGENVTYNFSDFKTFKELFRDLYYRHMSIDQTENKKDEFNGVLSALSIYLPREQKDIDAKNNL